MNRERMGTSLFFEQEYRKAITRRDPTEKGTGGSLEIVWTFLFNKTFQKSGREKGEHRREINERQDHKAVLSISSFPFRLGLES